MSRIGAGLYETTVGDVRLSISDVTAHSGRLDAWCEVHAGNRRLTFGDMNLRGARTVSTLARACAEAAPSLKMDWLGFLSEAIYECVHDTLEGEAPVELTTTTAQEPGWVVQDLVGDVGATSLVGYGQTGKSMIALAAACTVASGDDVWLGLPACDEGAVLYLDYEAGRESHEWRLAQLCRGANNRPVPRGVYHRRESMPLHRSVPAITRHAHRVGARLLIVDSVMLARGGSDTFGHEGTISLYAALAQIGLPCLLVDHRAKNQDSSGPWGSVINFNSLRLAWGVNTSICADGIDITLKKIKANYHGWVKDHHWRLTFADQNRAAVFEQSSGPLGPGVDQTVTDKVLNLLRRAGDTGMTVKDLAAETGATDATVRKLLTRLRDRGLVRSWEGYWVAASQDGQEEAPF